MMSAPITNPVSRILEEEVMEDQSVTTPVSLIQEDRDMEVHVDANQLKRTPRLSIVSSKYDVGGKGYLDEEECILRAYDTNNDGKLDTNELKRIVQDLRHTTNQKTLLRKLVFYGSITVVLSILCNFALVWTALALTSKLGTHEGYLVDSSGKRVITQVGRRVVAKPNPEYFRRFLEIQGRRLISSTVGDKEFNFQAELRHLAEEVPVAELEDVDGRDAKEIFENYQDGTVPIVSVTVNGKTFTGGVASGATYFKNSEGCDVYDNIKEQGTAEPTYKVECCGGSGDSTCQAYENIRDDNRMLAKYCCMSSNQCYEGEENAQQHCPNESVGCFSSASTVIEKNEGEILMKDLKKGDFILAASGKFQPFLLSIHSNPHKLATFVQIITTDYSGGATPFEATPNHLVFLYDRDTPIQAGNVKVGDVMIGTDGPKTVSKVKMVTREGFYAPLTGDATLFVNGILAASGSAEIGTEDGFENVNFGPFQINIHSLATWFAVPLTNTMCNLVDSFFCETQVDDGEGGTFNLLISSFLGILTFSPVIQAIVFPLIAALAVIGILTYVVVRFLLLTYIILGFSFIFKLKIDNKMKCT